MKFRLGTIAYVFALLAAGMAAFGNWGILAAAAAGVFWARALSRRWESVKVPAVVMTLMLLMVAALGGALSVAREAAQQSSCHGRLCQLAHVLNHGGNNISYPAAVMRDGAGKPLHSWRTVAMQQAGWLNSTKSAVDFAQPWNSSVNQGVLGGENDIYHCSACRAGTSETEYYAVVGERTAWPADRGRPFAEITDDPDLTILLVESWRKNAPWAAPVDLTFDEAVDLLSEPPLPRTGHKVDRSYFHLPSQRVNVAFVSGRYASLQLPLRREVAVALLTVDGGEKIDEAEWRSMTESAFDYQAIYGLGAFVALTLWPSVRWRRGKEEPSV